MSKIEQRRETRLETAPIHEVGAILDFKLGETSPEGVADYIGLSLQNLDDRLMRIKEAEANIKSLKAELTSQAETIKIGSAKWLAESGIDKLQGMAVSSVSISKSKPKEELIVTNEESLINQGFFKTTLDKTAVKNAIMNDIVVEGACVEITHTEDKIRVNRRKNLHENKRD